MFKERNASVQDYSAEQEKDLQERNLFDERGHLNEELLARPDEIILEDYADPEEDENAPFVPVSLRHCQNAPLSAASQATHACIPNTSHALDGCFALQMIPDLYDIALWTPEPKH